MDSISSGRRLAKNTAFMYFRMLFLMIISLYTTRVVLKQLGVEDYGVYNLVGSILVMFSSLRTIFSASTQRFLNYEMGKGNIEKLQLVFNLSIYINIAICIVFLILVESVGMWFLFNKANIDSSRLPAAIWVFQFSIVSSLLNIFVTSYDALIIAHEKMDFFAYLSIFEGILKLLIVFTLSLVDVDKLIFYGFLLLIVSIIVVGINCVYCLRNFPESRFKRSWDLNYLKQMTVFAGWNFFGKTSFALTQSGLNMVLNVFGGPIVNAARGVAFQVNSATNQFLNNINIVLNPYCVKIYAEGQMDKFRKMLYLSTKIFFYVQSCLVIPLYFLGEIVLKLWLGEVPEYSFDFLKLILIWSLIRSVHAPIDNLFKAKGDMKYYQLFEGIVLALPVLIGWITLRMGLPYASVFVVVNIIEVINLVGITILANKIAALSLKEYFKKGILPCLLSFIPAALIMFIGFNLAGNICRQIIVTVFLIVSSTIIMYLIGLDAFEKQQIKSLIKKR